MKSIFNFVKEFLCHFTLICLCQEKLFALTDFPKAGDTVLRALSEEEDCTWLRRERRMPWESDSFRFSLEDGERFAKD